MKRPTRMRPMIADDEYFVMSTDDCVRSDPPHSAETKETPKIGFGVVVQSRFFSFTTGRKCGKQINKSINIFQRSTIFCGLQSSAASQKKLNSSSGFYLLPRNVYQFLLLIGRIPHVQPTHRPIVDPPTSSSSRSRSGPGKNKPTSL